MHQSLKLQLKSLLLPLLLAGLLAFSPSAHSQTVDELKLLIEEQNRAIAELDREREAISGELSRIDKQGNTLENEKKRMEATRRQIQNDINSTETKIKSTELTITKLSLEINARAADADRSRDAIAESIRFVAQNEDNTLPEVLLASWSLSQFVDASLTLTDFQGKIRERLKDVEQAKLDLEGKKVLSEKAKKELVALKTDLAARRKILDDSIKSQLALIKETANKETEYRKKLADVEARRAAFERELASFESQLNLTVDASRIPSSGSGVLRWPLDKVTITQYFGNTEFATKNAQIYNGKGHPGVDFRASVGTRVRNALSGVVTATGNTDLVRGCYSYGKWVLVRHGNGLSTLYAHLSVISVREGESIATGDLVGYSGNTGASTGPHLHFGVYATQGVRVVKYETSINCKNAVIPVADPKAYLNPLSYL
jgi:murein DD-endopeptidase MepM/ murein hydrolase activator NlpD